MTIVAFVPPLPLLAPCRTISALPLTRRARCLSSRGPAIVVRAAPRASADTASGGGNQGGDFDIGNVLAGLLTFALTTAPEAAYAVPDVLVNTFKTKPASLVHPGVMWLVFASAVYAFYLGWQSRQIRDAEPEKRKELVKSKVTARHFSLASQLFAVTTVFTFGGMANTFTRTGKLFPGPHLYCGLSIVALLSVMSSLVPKMQSGKLWARNTHFALAIPTLALFGWQAKSGMVIVGKLLGWS